jgi:flagellar hook protein FlgE
MIASLYAGISGLSANATAMTVIGDNIANVNTTAFKSNRSHFANILSTSLGGESATAGVGRGVEFWGVNAQWTQGSLENSASATDLAGSQPEREWGTEPNSVPLDVRKQACVLLFCLSCAGCAGG